MYIHKEGRKLIGMTFAIVMVIFTAMIFLVPHWTFFHGLFIAILFALWVAVALFFRIPRRVFTDDSQRFREQLYPRFGRGNALFLLPTARL